MCVRVFVRPDGLGACVNYSYTDLESDCHLYSLLTQKILGVCAVEIFNLNIFGVILCDDMAAC